MEKQKAIIVSGCFNPFYKGHLEYFNNAKAMADQLFVIVNNDHQREFDFRFANGGDQNNQTIPERAVCEEINVALIDRLRGKIQSYSWLLNKQ